jgi:hypothetical protein
MPRPPAIKSRKPTGEIPWPFVLLEGEEKAGKSHELAVFSASDRIGDSYWLDLGEGSADEYGAIPGARYQVLEHDGLYISFLEQIRAVWHEAKRAADAGEPPVALLVDGGTPLWRMLVDWTNDRARRSKAGQRKLADDPDAEIDPTMNLWNDANNRHRAIVDLLMTFPGIAVMTARGKLVSAIDEKGQPIANRKEYKVDGQKDLAYDASAWIRMHRSPRRAELIGGRGLKLGQVDGAPKPLPDFSLESFIFEVLGAGGQGTHARAMNPLRGDLLQVVSQRLAASVTPEEVRALWEDTQGKLRPEDWEEFKAAALARVEKIKAEDQPEPEPEVPEVNFDDPEPTAEQAAAKVAAELGADEIVGDVEMFGTPHAYKAHGPGDSAADKSCQVCGAFEDEEGNSHTAPEPDQLPEPGPEESNAAKLRKAAAKKAAPAKKAAAAKPATSDEFPAEVKA